MTVLDQDVPYRELTPDRMLNAVEGVGFRCDGRLFPLNSYENRVYQVGIEEAEPLVVKFYRPRRWSNEAILEEHAFAQQLAEREIPVVSPIQDSTGHTLFEFEGYRFALYPRRGGRAPELDDPRTLEWIGRFIARIHAVGAVEPFIHRPALTVESFGDESVAYVLAGGFIPSDLAVSYRTLAQDVLERVRRCFERAGDVKYLRLHGDCHAGNILWTDRGPHFVDLDDSRMGPAVQDVWMLLSGERDAMSVQLNQVMKGYREFHDFDPRELHLLEALRTLRMIHYSAWLARRWNDPAFPANFPWFNTQRYWQEQILALREQAALMDEAPLALQ